MASDLEKYLAKKKAKEASADVGPNIPGLSKAKKALDPDEKMPEESESKLSMGKAFKDKAKKSQLC